MTDSQQPHQYPPPHEVYNGGYHQPSMEMHSAQDPRQHVYSSQAAAAAAVQAPYSMVYSSTFKRLLLRDLTYKIAICRPFISSSTSNSGVQTHGCSNSSISRTTTSSKRC